MYVCVYMCVCVSRYAYTCGGQRLTSAVIFFEIESLINLEVPNLARLTVQGTQGSICLSLSALKSSLCAATAFSFLLFFSDGYLGWNSGPHASCLYSKLFTE